MTTASDAQDVVPLAASVVLPVTRTTVATLRRSSSQVTPTRTLILSEHEHREVTPVRIVVTEESLANRPRSNQRTRTPRRYESPLDPDAFRRVADDRGEEGDGAHVRIISVGNRGTDRARPISEVPLVSCPSTTTLVPPFPLGFSQKVSLSLSLLFCFFSLRHIQSHKQGPSHRKVRRWRNDRFDDLASEVAQDKGHGSAAADALRRAKDKAHLYRDIVNFRDMSPDPLTR